MNNVYIYKYNIYIYGCVYFVSVLKTIATETFGFFVLYKESLYNIKNTKNMAASILFRVYKASPLKLLDSVICIDRSHFSPMEKVSVAIVLRNHVAMSILFCTKNVLYHGKVLK